MGSTPGQPVAKPLTPPGAAAPNMQPMTPAPPVPGIASGPTGIATPAPPVSAFGTPAMKGLPASVGSPMAPGGGAGGGVMTPAPSVTPAVDQPDPRLKILQGLFANSGRPLGAR